MHKLEMDEKVRVVENDNILDKDKAPEEQKVENYKVEIKEEERRFIDKQLSLGEHTHHSRLTEWEEMVEIEL